ncbi:MAG: hypothetical protein CM1200mP22_07330 [Dehalococcoidia bacterium]|nr:MAG: hypothetical protein CM1200mP22_07330 [Dehalococcoidia bacterium]
MAIYRVFDGGDGESHTEEMKLEEHPELGAMKNLPNSRLRTLMELETWTSIHCPNVG